MMKLVMSPKELAEAIGVSESSLKRWADDGLIAVSRTAGGHRRIALAEAIRFIRASGLPVLRPQVLGLKDLQYVRNADLEPDHSARLLEKALIDGHAEKSRGMILSLYLSGQTLAQVFDGPVATAMHHVGELWQHSEDGIFIEHRATDLCMQAIGHIRALLPPPADDAPVAVGGVPGGDPYVLPSMMAAAVLAAEGWRDMNLGANTPLEVLTRAATELNARLVWLSCSAEQSPEKFRPPLLQLAHTLAARGAAFAVGGRGWPAKMRDLPASVHYGASMAELTAFARGLKASVVTTAPVGRSAGAASPAES